MNEGSGRAGGRSTGWPYVVTGALFAGICAWISYNDGLFVARLAGNHDRLAYFYPLLPDGLIVLCLLALAEAARAGVRRSKWAMAGLVLGIALTLAMNTGAGVAHSVLDAVLDAMVPVVFLIAAEVVLWHVRRARNDHGITEGRSATGAVPSSAEDAAKASMAATVAAGNPWSQNQLQVKFGLSRAQAREIWAEHAPNRGQGGTSAAAPAARSQSPALATQDPPAGAVEHANPAAPAGAGLNGAGHG